MAEDNKGEAISPFEDFRNLYSKLTGAIHHCDIQITLKGFKMPAWFPRFWPQIYNLPVESDDVIIVTFPKSGSTWIEHMIYLIVSEDFEAASVVPVKERVPFLDMPQPPTVEAYAQLAARPSPRIMRTHSPADFLPKNANKGKVVYCYRNLKDVIVSYFHFYNGYVPVDGTEKTIEEIANEFLNGEITFAPYPKHLQSYLQYQMDGNKILMIRYEDMKADSRAVIRKIALFLNKELSDATVEKIFNATTFSAMRENQTTNREGLKKHGYFKDGSFIRKGIVGDWKNHFNNPELLKRIDDFITKEIPEEFKHDD